MAPSLDTATLSRTLPCVLTGVLTIASLLCAPRSQAHPIKLAVLGDTTAQRAATPSEQRTGPQMGALVQTVLHTANGPSSFPEGFHVPRARLEAEGQFEAISYEVEADFADDALLKDARIGYRVVPHLTLGTGRFKVPFSYGELVSSAETDFVQRPRVVRQLSIGRRTGVDATVQTRNERLQLHGGIFSGRERAASADNPEDWLSAARVTWTATTQGMRSIMGLNTAYVRYADGGRVRYGADVRLTRGPAFLTAEVLTAPDARTSSERGAYVTMGYALSAAHLVRVQWDYLAVDTPTASDAPAPSRSLIGVGYTLQIAAPLRIEVDYLTPPATDAFNRSAVFVNLQIDL